MTVADDTWDEPPDQLEQQAAQQDTHDHPSPVARLADRNPGHRTPPHDPDAEAAVLGAALIHPESADTTVALLDPGDYYRPAHTLIHQAIADLLEQGEPADTLTVANHLRSRDLLDQAGGLAELIHLTATCPGVANTRHYAHIIRNHATRRRLIAAATTIADTTWTLPSARAAAGQAQTLLDTIHDRTDTTGTTQHIADHLPSQLELLEARHDGTTTAGVPTGLIDLDHYLGGLHPGQLIVCGARPGVGKTDLALWIARHAAQQGHPVLHASLEMGATELLDRLIAAQSKVHYDRIRRGTDLADRDWHAIADALEHLAAIPLTIRDDASDTVAGIRAAARRIDGLALIVVDYLQLITPGHRSGDRRVDVDEISRSLKRLARDLQVPVLVLAQLNRAVEARHDKHPMLSDFRESGGIEADADTCLALYRDELHKPDSDDKGVMEILVLKQRAGALGTAKVAYQPGRKTFADLAGLNDRNPM